MYLFWPGRLNEPSETRQANEPRERAKLAWVRLFNHQKVLHTFERHFDYLRRAKRKATFHRLCINLPAKKTSTFKLCMYTCICVCGCVWVCWHIFYLATHTSKLLQIDKELHFTLPPTQLPISLPILRFLLLPLHLSFSPRLACCLLQVLFDFLGLLFG